MKNNLVPICLLLILLSSCQKDQVINESYEFNQERINIEKLYLSIRNSPLLFILFDKASILKNRTFKLIQEKEIKSTNDLQNLPDFEKSLNENFDESTFNTLILKYPELQSLLPNELNQLFLKLSEDYIKSRTNNPFENNEHNLFLVDKCYDYYKVATRQCDITYYAEYLGCGIATVVSGPFAAFVGVGCVTLISTQLIYCYDTAKRNLEICGRPD